MGVSLILSFGTCYIFAIASFFVWWQIIKSESRNRLLSLFGWSWFLAGGIVGFMGLRTMLFGLGFVIWDLAFALVDQFFLIGFFIIASYYVLEKNLGEKKARTIIYCFVAPLSLLVVLSIFIYMVDIANTVNEVNLDVVRAEIVNRRHVSDWGSEFIPPESTINIFVFLTIFLLTFLSFDFLKQLYLRMKKQILDNDYDMLFTLSLIIFLIALVFDQRGIDAGWKLLLYRIFGMLAAMLAYVACSGKLSKNSI